MNKKKETHPAECWTGYVQYCMCWMVLAPVLLLTFPKISGRQYLRTNGSVLIISKHVSNADYPYLAVFSRKLYAVLKKELYDFWPSFFRRGGAIRIDRDEPDRSTLTEVKLAHKLKRAVLLFAEKHRSPHVTVNDIDRAVRAYLASAETIVFVGLEDMQPWVFWRRPKISVSRPIPRSEVPGRDHVAQWVSDGIARQQAAARRM